MLVRLWGQVMTGGGDSPVKWRSGQLRRVGGERVIRLGPGPGLETANTVKAVGPVPGEGGPASEAQQQRHSEGGDHDHHQNYQSLHLYLSPHAGTR